ncbi:helix-turn-helix domain-containing protein [Vibrio gallaecicus]|uniref:helix-turn-helix domain-containing protein n=1 Tax=Vibrio gallaecicus TaxID=552386 RepID=UPI0010C9B27B|nr:helix-turn-helix transcriptional regulator [Vibrio gallaecicus]MDN3613057.1 helix-turn-helix transcriptional regulator [Vibrio gallaecicus]
MAQSFSSQLPIFWFNILDSALEARVGDTSEFWEGDDSYQALLSADSVSAYQLQAAIAHIYQQFGYELIDIFSESAEYFDELELGPPVLAMLTAPTLTQFCELLSRYSIHIHPLLKIFSRETDSGGLELWVVTPEYVDEITLMTHMSLGLYYGLILKLIRRYLNAPNQLVAIHFNRHTVGEEFLPIFERVFNVQMKQGYPVRYFYFSEEVVNMRGREYLADFHLGLKQMADKQLESVLESSMLFKVNEAFKTVPVKDISQENIASTLCMSTRTLNRKLQQEGINFRRLFDKYRLELSLTMLNRNEANITLIALELGFSDSSAFSRAFRKWTGQSPGQIRQNKLEGGQ